MRSLVGVSVLSLVTGFAFTLASACSSNDPTSSAPQGENGGMGEGGPSGSSTPVASNGDASFANCGSVATTGTLPADVDAVLQAKCQLCHTDPPQNGAPFPLKTYADLHATFVGSIPRYQEAYALIQPDGMPHMPFGNAPQLTTDEFAILSSWLAACAPPSN